MRFEEDFKSFPLTFHSHYLDCDQSATHWLICTKFYTKPHQSMEHNYEHLRDNQTVFYKDMQDCLSLTQYAGICSFIFCAFYGLSKFF